jgi:23S rRNA (adenine2030-N6)-methyltransferase
MNYRHAFHAGSFADVVKHAVLVRILMHLREKPAAFRVLDTHAGAGIYDLAGPEASRSGEWRAGINRLLTTPLDQGAGELISPYLQVVSGLNACGPIKLYPGSPALARALLRPQDRLVACELEPNAAAALARHVGGERRVTVAAIDGWTALKAYVPPPERRGLVLIDPPYEETADFTRLFRGLETAHRKWSTGIFLLWYPIKGRVEADAFARRLKKSLIAKILRAELCVAATPAEGPLGGCGLIIVNPPWRLEIELATLLPALASTLGGTAGSFRIDWLAPES